MDADVQREMRETTGAVVLGRRTFDVGVGEWEDTPYPVPCFVLTHEPLEERVEKVAVSSLRTSRICGSES